MNRTGLARGRPLFFVALVVLTVLAARSDVAAGMSRSEVIRDLSVGIVLALAGLGMVARPLAVALFGLAGLAWLVASVDGSLSSVHAGLLILALLSLPRGPIRVRSRDGVAALLAVAVAVGFVPQFGVAAVFVVTAALVLRLRAGLIGVAASGAAMVLAVVYAGLWTWSRAGTETFDPGVGLEVYQITLVLVAIALVVLTRLASAGAARRPFVALEEVDRAGLGEFERALGVTLGRPDLRVYRWVEATAWYVDADGAMVAQEPGEQWLRVSEAGRHVAAMVVAGSASVEGPLGEAVAQAVRIACRNEDLRGQLEARLEDLEHSRARLLAAADDARAGTSRALAADVEGALAGVLEGLRVRDPDRLGDGGALRIAEQELSRTSADLARIVAGAPPADLGEGRVVSAVRDLVAACGLPCTVRVAGAVAADQEAETTIFYVCSEGIANVIKHAHASRLEVELSAEGGVVTVVVRDDGVGGADVTGPGLQGLADRVATRGGRLRVESTPGVGTVAEAHLPIRSWSTA